MILVHNYILLAAPNCKGRKSTRGHTYAVVVNDIDNDGELAGIRAIVNHDNTADLNDTLESKRALLG